MTSVLVVDDQGLIRAGLAAIVRAAPGLELTAEAGSGEEAVVLAASTGPDVILMDIRMPGMGGLAATRHIIDATPQRPPKVLVLTTFDLDEYVYAALRAGACGFLLKDAGPERLLQAIATVAAGDMLFAPSVVRKLVEANASRPAAPRPHTLRDLTARETEVLELVARGLSNPEIADRLGLSEATVKTHVNRIMSKLHLASRAQAVVVAYEARLVVPGS
ncbi:response regulator [Virgisporangium aurantiacum]|uniref:DNA-binding response regulator n=1 Tax=Virgisporangium aurantiacum TaxID=175570 RepID=A0A8J3ZA07_9ACTN|nr:response regulator transcription factor [Virgisporangium aurantiacum]GIJ57548.1 DNA-binding response regulator [Virgisporangium aurantiacum]